jgi:L-iditol 2-dehydrogenase
MICASAKAMFAESLKITKKLGNINFFAGLPKDDSLILVDANLIHYNEIEITGTSDSTPEQNKKAIELLNSGKVKVANLITHKYSLEKYFEGLEMAKSGKAMKVVINT